MAVVYSLLLGCVFGLLVGLALGAGSEQYNEYAYLLGKVVEAKKYEGSDWERYLVICVSWHGALRLRPLGDPDPSYSFWLDKTKRETRLREIV